MSESLYGSPRSAWPVAIDPSVIAMTDSGLVCGSDLVLAPMTKRADGRRELALDGKQDRIVALLSVAAGRPLAAADVLPPIGAAADYWRRGDKALANLRLVFAGLPRLSPEDADRLRLAIHLLDSGVSPPWLMAELWPPPPPLGKYNPAQPRVPAGHGAESGRWESEWGAGPARPSREPSGRFDVAAGPGRPEDEKQYEERRLLGGTTPEEDIRHHHPVDPLADVPRGVGPSTANQVSAAARAAAEAVGPGRGPVYGTRVYAEFKTRVKGLDRPDLHTEESYLNGKCVEYGTAGSVRVDVAHGLKDKPYAVDDLKTGSARLTESRVRNLRQRLPSGQDVQIREVKP